MLLENKICPQFCVIQSQLLQLIHKMCWVMLQNTSLLPSVLFLGFTFSIIFLLKCCASLQTSWQNQTNEDIQGQTERGRCMERDTDRTAYTDAIRQPLQIEVWTNINTFIPIQRRSKQVAWRRAIAMVTPKRVNEKASWDRERKREEPCHHHGNWKEGPWEAESRG